MSVAPPAGNAAQYNLRILRPLADFIVTEHGEESLAGIYEGNRVVEVPLLTYLRRVENFKGIIVTRLDSEAAAGAAFSR